MISILRTCAIAALLNLGLLQCAQANYICEMSEGENRIAAGASNEEEALQEVSSRCARGTGNPNGCRLINCHYK